MSRKISDEEILGALLSCRTQHEAAQKLNIQDMTISRRMKRPEFKKKLAERRQIIFEAVNNELIQASVEAATALRKLLESSNESIRFSTASRILSLAESYITMYDLQAKLEELEQRIT